MYQICIFVYQMSVFMYQILYQTQIWCTKTQIWYTKIQIWYTNMQIWYTNRNYYNWWPKSWFFSPKLYFVYQILILYTVSAPFEPHSWIEPHPPRNHAKMQFLCVFHVTIWKIELQGSNRADTVFASVFSDS